MLSHQKLHIIFNKIRFIPVSLKDLFLLRYNVLRSRLSVLIIFSGLPASGKSTVSRLLAERLGALYLRIDTIETAIKNSALKVSQAEDAGYLAAFDIAKDNLKLGLPVVADSVNPINICREGWRQTALESGKKYLEIEILCSSQREHKRRLEARNADREEATPIVAWEDVIKREYAPWDKPILSLDTFKYTRDECVEVILKNLLQCNQALGPIEGR